MVLFSNPTRTKLSQQRQRSIPGGLCQIVLSALVAVSQLAGATKLSHEFDNIDSKSRVDVIVQFQAAPTTENHARVGRLGGQLRHSFEIINAAHYTVPASSLAALAGDSEVVAISPDRKLSATGSAVTTPDYGWMGLLALTSPTAYASDDGSGVGVAILDSGIGSSADFYKLNSTSSRVLYSQSFVSGDSSTGDKYGHGTHVAGLVAGSGYNSDGFESTYVIKGAAPNANLINLRVLDQNGNSTDSVVIAAIQRAIALKSKYNILVMNLSLGRPGRVIL